MSKGRIYNATLTGVGAVKARIYRAQMTGAVPPGVKGRIYKAGMTGVAGVALAPFTNQAAEPLTPVTLTAVLAAGSATPDSYTWRVVSGSPVAIVGTGASVVVTAPTCTPGAGTGPVPAFTVIGVKATKAGVASPEVTVRIDSPTNQWWQATPTGLVAVRGPQYA
jgi:hypothetical protein